MYKDVAHAAGSHHSLGAAVWIGVHVREKRTQGRFTQLGKELNKVIYNRREQLREN